MRFKGIRGGSGSFGGAFWMISEIDCAIFFSSVAEGQLAIGSFYDFRCGTQSPLGGIGLIEGKKESI